MQSNAHPPVLVLLEKKAIVDHNLLKQWLEVNGFLAWNAEDVFDALEELADFTVRSRPDVILLEVGSLADDFRMIRSIVNDEPEGKSTQAIFALSDGRKSVNHSECYEGDLNQLKARLDRIIPKRNYAQAAV